VTRCVADTNIVVYYLNQVGGDDFRRRFGEMVNSGAVISVITRIEVLGWPGYADASPAMTTAEALLSTLREEPLTEPIVQEAIALRRNYRIKVPDAIVAATANVLGLPLMTNNTEDFRRVAGLTLISPAVSL
jgi:predicted nucleic acid-binding protein